MLTPRALPPVEGPFGSALRAQGDLAQRNAVPTRQHLVLLEKFGGAEGFSVVDAAVPQPGPGEVLVKVLAASVQYTDVVLRKGRDPELEDKPPLVLGYDLVGEVLRVGPGVRFPVVGQRVVDLTMQGSYAQYRTLKADRVIAVAATLDPGEVTSLVLSWMTAFQLLHRVAQVKRGQQLLVVGAAGAVGQALVVLGKLAGCKVWGAARARHQGAVEALGATFVDSELQDFTQLRPRGFDAVFDGIGEAGFQRSFAAVGPRGHLAAFGVSSAIRMQAPNATVGLWLARLWAWNLFAPGRSAHFFSIAAARRKNPSGFKQDLAVLLGLLARRDIQPNIALRIGLEDVANAHVRLERGGLEGKIVLMPNG